MYQAVLDIVRVEKVISIYMGKGDRLNLYMFVIGYKVYVELLNAYKVLPGAIALILDSFIIHLFGMNVLQLDTKRELN